MKYLIMKCETLGDQWECDADRKPVTMTDDWKEWVKSNMVDYDFEVYEFVENSFKLVKSYEEYLEEGMCLAFFDENDKGHFITKYPNKTRDNKIPKEIRQRASKGEDYDDCLSSCGFISWIENGVLYSYTEYADNRVYTPF